MSPTIQTEHHPDGVPLYMTPNEVAALLQLSPKTIYRLAALDPSMPMLKLGGTVRFPRERLLHWLQAREQGPGRGRAAVRRTGALSRQVADIQGSVNGSAGSCAEACAT